MEHTINGLPSLQIITTSRSKLLQSWNLIITVLLFQSPSMEFIPPSESNYNHLPAYLWDTQTLLPTETNDSIWSTVTSLLCNGSGFDSISPENNRAISDFRTSFPDRFGVTEVDLDDLMLKLDVDGAHSCGFSQGWGSADIHGTGSGLVPEFRCDCGATRDEWEIHGSTIAKDGQAGVKIPRYSVEERKDRILRYLKKRNQRNFNKTIKYACRKTLADRRRRVRGRFASNNEIHEAVGEYHDDIGKIQDNNGDDCCKETMCVYNWLNDIEL